MRQSRLEEYYEKPEYKCPACGRIFNTYKGCNIHIKKAHSIQETPLISPGESIEIKEKGAHTIITLKIQQSRWKDLQKRCKEWNIKFDELFFDALANMQAFGNEYQFWTRDPKTYKTIEKPPYFG